MVCPQGRFFHEVEYWNSNRKTAYESLKAMLGANVQNAVLEALPEDVRPSVPFGEREAVAWNNEAGIGRGNP